MDNDFNNRHPFRGDLEAYLTSPRGTTSRLFIRNGDDRTPTGSPGIDWWFSSNAFWGENPSGSWTLTVKDRFQGDTGTWGSYQFRARMGELIAAANPSPPTLTCFSPAGGSVGTTVNLLGSKLTGASAVKFNGVNAAAFDVNSDTEIRATVPVGATMGPISVTTPGGIQEAGEPDHAGNSGGKSVWYRWTAPSDGTWSLDTSGSSFDTLLAVYTGSSPGGLTAIASNDDSGEGVTSKVTFAAVAGTVYQIAVDGYNGDSGSIFLKLIPAVVPILIYSTGFELAEGFQSGLSLAGQDGWMKLSTGGNGVASGFFFDLGQQAYIGFDPR